MLVSQSYGMQNYYMCGVYLNRGRVILMICFIPMAILLSQTEIFFRAFNMEAETANYAGEYITLMIPGVFFQMHYDATKSYLNGLGVTHVPMLINLITTMFHSLWCYLLLGVG